MTKIFSAVFFAILLVGTWALVKNRPAVSYQTHTDMQATLVRVITTQLAKEKPNARNFVIQELKSENLTDNAVRVIFRYEFEEPDVNGTYAKVQRAGKAELMRAAAQEPGAPEVWQLREGQVLESETLIIQDPQKVIPGEASEPEDTPTQPADAGTGAPATTGDSAAPAATGTSAAPAATGVGAAPAATPTPVASPTPGDVPGASAVER